jgi:DNA-binding LacI/PurR family transcriptional regulator
MGEMAVEVLMEMIEGNSEEVRQISLGTELVVRGSCRELEKN